MAAALQPSRLLRDMITMRSRFALVGRRLAAWPFALSAVLVACSGPAESATVSSTTPTTSVIVGSEPASSSNRTTIPDSTPASEPSTPNGAANAVHTLQDISPPSAELAVLIWRARETLAQRCMKTKGFDYSMLPPPDLVGKRNFFREHSDLTPQTAAKVGYHGNLLLPSTVTSADDNYNRVADANQARAIADTSFQQALVGLDTPANSGCRGEADRAIFGPAGTFNKLVSPDFAEANSFVSKIVGKDHRVLDALAAWKVCMKASGFDFAGLGAGPALYTSATAVSPEEIRTAVADAMCRTSSGVEELLHRAQSDAVQAWIDGHQGAFLGERDVEQTLTSKLLALLASS